MNNKIIIVDIDNTISKVGDRKRHLNENPPNYEEFHKRCNEDKPIEHIINLIYILSFKYKIVYVTMRPETLRYKTNLFITNTKLFYNASNNKLLMRKVNDKRNDSIIKLELIKQHRISINDIEFAIEDNDSVIRAYTKAGIKCIKVIEDYKPKRIRKANHKTRA